MVPTSIAGVIIKTATISSVFAINIYISSTAKKKYIMNKTTINK